MNKSELQRAVRSALLGKLDYIEGLEYDAKTGVYTTKTGERFIVVVQQSHYLADFDSTKS